MIEPDEWSKNQLGCIAEPLILHRWLADNSGCEDRLCRMGDRSNMEDRKLPGMGVMAEVIAEWSFEPPFLRRDDAFEDKLRVTWPIDRNRLAARHRRRMPAKKSREEDFVQSFWKRRDGGH